MRSLTLKLTLAFLFVGLAGTVLAAFIIQRRTHADFDHFLYDQDANVLGSALIEHYRAMGSWQGIEEIIPQLSRYWRMPDDMGKMPSHMRRMGFTLVDAQGVVVFGRDDELGKTIPKREIEKGIPLVVNDEHIGTVLGLSTNFINQAGTPENDFLGRINQSILISAWIAAGIALLLGALLARTLMRPIRELTQATQLIARGELGYQVQVRSQDELGHLATSFNRMSADLASANQLRRQMTADIAHDLRTPLSLILGYTEALSEGKLAGTPEVFTVMHQEASHLSHLIDDLRMLSLADAGELPLNLQKVSPRSLLERAAATFKPQTDEKEIVLVLDCSDQLPFVEVDPERMAQVLSNLVGNALRYTPEGGQICLAAIATGESVILQVRDNGAGIAEEDLPHIFERFYRGDKSRLQNGEAGLGLTIVRSLVEAHGGEISVKSEFGSGTEFIISLHSMGT